MDAVKSTVRVTVTGDDLVLWKINTILFLSQVVLLLVQWLQPVPWIDTTIAFATWAAAGAVVANAVTQIRISRAKRRAIRALLDAIHAETADPNPPGITLGTQPSIGNN